MAKKSLKSSFKAKPIGVTILAILAYVGAVLSLLLGIAMLFGSAIIGPILSKLPDYAKFADWGAIAFIFFGLFFIAAAVLDFLGHPDCVVPFSWIDLHGTPLHISRQRGHLYIGCRWLFHYPDR